MGLLGVTILVPGPPGLLGVFQLGIYAGMTMYYPTWVVTGPGAAYVFNWEIRPAKYNPETEPSSHKSNIHWVANVTVITDGDEPLRRSDRCGRTASGPAKVPHTAERNREAQNRGNHE